MKTSRYFPFSEVAGNIISATWGELTLALMSWGLARPQTLA